MLVGAFGTFKIAEISLQELKNKQQQVDYNVNIVKLNQNSRIMIRAQQNVDTNINIFRPQGCRLDEFDYHLLDIDLEQIESTVQQDYIFPEKEVQNIRNECLEIEDQYQTNNEQLLMKSVLQFKKNQSDDYRYQANFVESEILEESQALLSENELSDISDKIKLSTGKQMPDDEIKRLIRAVGTKDPLKLSDYLK